MANTLWDTRIGDVKVPFLVGGVGTTLVATRDPLVTDDITQGIAVGAIWFNNAAGFKREWECVSNAAGAAAWVFSGANYAGGGTNPSTEVTQFGLGAALMAAEGNINRQVSSAGINPGATGVDSVLAVFSLQLSSFDVLGRGINIAAMGSMTNAATAKLVKLIWGATTAVVGSTVTGGTAIASFTDSTANSLGGWQLAANVFKYGAAASNTQIALHEVAQSGSVVGALTAPSLLTAPENAAILIAVTGNAAATANIVLNFLGINAMN
jgi:hypothetical protein